MALLEPILEKLDSAQHNLLRAADAIPADVWKTPPRGGVWSAAEIMAHVMSIERTVIGAAERIFKKQPRQTPLLKRFRLPFALAEIRVIRMKTPIPIDPKLLREKEIMFAELREVRGRTLALIEETRNRDLGVYRWRHPFLGSLNGYEWFLFLASHEIRHEKQMREIATNLPKTIQNSQK
ncbi:MAG: DinB family protein [Candidatus Acidoferrum typicum]|nr:DinB family protein [Candidatus Acidoferrum typicum]